MAHATPQQFPAETIAPRVNSEEWLNKAILDTSHKITFLRTGVRSGACAVGRGRSVCQDCVVYAERPFAGPKQVLAYLARYTHRVAIDNSRLLHLSDEHVSFRWKDYRENGDHKSKVMKLAVAVSRSEV
jgi:hypothetical protein